MIAPPRNRLLTLALLCALVPLAHTGGPALGQSKDQPLALGAPTGASQNIRLATSKATLLRLPVRVSDVIVADPTIADVVVKSPSLLYVLGRQIGTTNAIFLDTESNVIYALNLTVIQDLTELRLALKTLLPEANVTATSLRGNVVLSGKVRSARAAEDARQLALRFVPAAANVISRLQVAADQQVMLRVRIVEVRRSIAKSLGISGIIGRGEGVSALGGTLVAPLVDTGITGPLASGQIRFGLFPGNPFRNIALAIDALESEGLIKTLAEPNLTALSGEGASFLAGGEIPVPAGLDRNGNLVIRFRDFGVSLGFTPTVLDSGRINMQVSTEVSEVDPTNAVTIQGLLVPGFRTRRAATTVEMSSGGALVIGGLLQNDFNNTVAGIPGIMNLPIIGVLFRSNAFTKGETELVVTVTAYIVRPADDRAVLVPADGFAPASDVDLYLFGRLHAQYGKKGTLLPKSRLHGPVGFVME